jgi:hypothetical protein
MSILEYAFFTVLVVFCIPILLVSIGAWRNRDQNRKETKQEPTKTATTAKAPAQALPVPKKKSENVLTDARFWAGVAILAIVFTFQTSWFFDGIPYEPYSIPNGMFYVPLAGLLYYSLSWTAVECFFSTTHERFNTLVLGLAIVLGIYTFIGGFVNNWHVPITYRHDVVHMIGTIPFMADVPVSWEFALGGFAVFFLVVKYLGGKMRIAGDFIALAIGGCLFLPQILQKIF